MFTGLWILVYTITIVSGPVINTQGQPIKYPYKDIAFETPSDWQGCANTKSQGAEALRKKLLENQGYKGVVVTAKCKQIGVN